MPDHPLRIAFIRRGFSETGGAEAYLKRLVAGISAAGHEAHLFTTRDWPADRWPDRIQRLRADSAIGFADEVSRLNLPEQYEVVMSLERIWRCDVYRAGDGVHQSWLRRRASIESPLQKFFRRFTRKHDETSRLEQSLLGQRGAGCIIANSAMVREEIRDYYGYPAGNIHVIHNGVPLEEFRATPALRASSRAALGLESETIAVLFVGSGWERKGLRYAIHAVENHPVTQLRLLVAGRGKARGLASSRVQFLGAVHDLPPIYAAADIFLLPTLYDPFSNACLEALAAGLPVITTAANGCREVIEDEIHGNVINEPWDLQAIRRALAAWSDPARRQQARAVILDRAARFDISVNVARTLDVLLQAARARA